MGQVEPTVKLGRRQLGEVLLTMSRVKPFAVKKLYKATNCVTDCVTTCITTLLNFGLGALLHPTRGTTSLKFKSAFLWLALLASTVGTDMGTTLNL